MTIPPPPEPHAVSVAAGRDMAYAIRADGTVGVGEAEGRKGKIVESLVVGHSVDFVTKPGAGGQVLQHNLVCVLEGR